LPALRACGQAELVFPKTEVLEQVYYMPFSVCLPNYSRRLINLDTRPIRDFSLLIFISSQNNPQFIRKVRFNTPPQICAQILFAMEQALGKIGLIGLKSGPLFPHNSKKLDKQSLSPKN
jgi:hypothetical protein